MLSLKWTDEIKKSENFEGSIIMPQKGLTLIAVDMPLAMLQIISTMTVTTITAKIVAQMIRFRPLFRRRLRDAFSKIYIVFLLIHKNALLLWNMFQV